MATAKRCDGISRRDAIRVGGLTALGLGLGDFFHLKNSFANEQPVKLSGESSRAKSCILIWLDGGPTHLETFDPKPNAPEEVRGPFGTIATKLTGVRINECLPLSAMKLDQFSIIRSMTSPLGEHNFGTHYLMTGYKPTPALEYPTFGATLAHLRSKESATSILPPHIAVPNFGVGGSNLSGHGYLPNATGPFSVGGNPSKPDFKVRDLDFYKGLDLTRLDRRKQFSKAFDQFSREKDASNFQSDPNLERAYNLIASSKAKGAFDLSKETVTVRNRYGMGGGVSIGQSCLLARRLVERGVPFVTVNNTGWDTHQNLKNLKSRFTNDRNAPLPALDRAFSALIEDLSERGMLDETLVVVMGEFGRTPKINSTGGRDHWPKAFSVVVAGGGIRGGQVIGSSDALGEFPKDDPVTPQDFAATLYTLLGIDPNHEMRTIDGRPVRVVMDGAKVIKDLI